MVNTFSSANKKKKKKRAKSDIIGRLYDAGLAREDRKRQERIAAEKTTTDNPFMDKETVFTQTESKANVPKAETKAKDNKSKFVTPQEMEKRLADLKKQRGGSTSHEPQEFRRVGSFVEGERDIGRVTGVRTPSGKIMSGSPYDIASIQQGMGGAGTGGAAAPQTMDIFEKEAIQRQLQEAGAFDTVNAQAEPLTPESRFGSLGEIPIVGSTTEAVASFLYNIPAVKQAGINQEVPLETAREIALSELKENSYKEGLSAAEKFGAFVEAIPVVGSLVGKYIGGLVEAPYANVKTIQSNINKQRERAVNLVEKTRMGAIEPELAHKTLQTMQDNIAKLEGRLQSLINSSALLRTNQDEINLLIEDIWRAKQVVEYSRQAVAIDMTRKLSGTGSAIPTDQQLYYELMKGG